MHQNRRKHEAEDEGAEPKSHGDNAGHCPLLSGNHLVTVVIGVT